MEQCEKELCVETEKIGKMGEKAIEEQEYTEALHGIIMLRKGQSEGREIWFGTVGMQLVSDGTYDSKKELIENLENLTLERICKIVAGAFERAITYNMSKK